MTKEKEMSEATPSAEVLARRKLFTAALRSGRFKQGSGQLAIGHGEDRTHCCLGVACEVAIENGLVLNFTDDENGDRWYPTIGSEGDAMLDNHSVLPTKVMEWYGWSDPDPDIPIEVHDEHGNPIEYEYPAAEVNDSKGRDFAEIADAFDAKYVHPYETPEDPSSALEP